VPSPPSWRFDRAIRCGNDNGASVYDGRGIFLYEEVDTFTDELFDQGSPFGYEYIFRRSRDKPKDSTSGSSYRFFFGGTTSGKAVTERSAMQMTAVYSCVRILSEAIAGLPIHLYRYGEAAARKKRPTIRSTSYCMMSQTRK
jgi:hypothetical protein